MTIRNRQPRGEFCSVNECDRPVLARTWCNKHYESWRRCGDPLTTTRNREERAKRRSEVRTCRASGCMSSNIKARGLCGRHHFQFLKYGNPLGPDGWLEGNDLHLPLRKRWGSPAAAAVGIGGAHARAYSLWGSASQYPCISCGLGASDWAYDGTDPTERFAAQTDSRVPRYRGWSRYSAYPEFYAPMCRRCHRKLDKRAAAAELREFREWKALTGLKLKDVCAVRAIIPPMSDAPARRSA